MRVGYARVSSADQNLDTQVERLNAEGCEKLFVEKVSGRNIEDRPELQTCLEFVREGDTLIALRLDRLTRGGMSETLALLQSLDKRGVKYKFLDNPNIDTTTTGGRIVTAVLAEMSFAFLEELRQKRTHGIALAKARGVYKGRPKTFDDAAIRQMRADGLGATEIMRKIGAKTTMTVYRALKGAMQ